MDGSIRRRNRSKDKEKQKQEQEYFDNLSEEEKAKLEEKIKKVLG